MYGHGGSIVGGVAAGSAAVATVLPNTGSNLLVTVAVAVAAGLVAWGVLHFRSARNAK